MPLATGFLLLSPAVQANSTFPTTPQLSSSDEHGCKAYLCFAGGMAFPECEPTIRKVKRDLARGRGFPQCSFLSNSDGSVGGQNGSPKIWTEYTKKRTYVIMQNPDGTRKLLSDIKRK